MIGADSWFFLSTSRSAPSRPCSALSPFHGREKTARPCNPRFTPGEGMKLGRAVANSVGAASVALRGAGWRGRPAFHLTRDAVMSGAGRSRSKQISCVAFA